MNTNEHNNEHSNEAEALFATKRKQQLAEEAERKRLEELERQKQQMAEEVKRLEALQAAQREQEARLAQEARFAQEARMVRQRPGGPETGAGPAGEKKGPDPKKKKLILLGALAALGVVALAVVLILVLGSKSNDKPGGSQTVEPSSSQRGATPERSTENGGEYDPELLYFNGHSYRCMDLDLSWNDARLHCIEQGGHLVTITSPEEQDFLANNFYDQKLWIGAAETQAGWCWVTDEAWSYENWREGEPSGGEEWCGALWTNMEWNDLRNEDPGERVSAFICEYDDLEDVFGTDWMQEDITPFCGMWKYDEFEYRIGINEDSTWTMYDAGNNETDGGICYWENGWLVLEETGGDYYCSLYLASEDQLSDDRGYSLSRCEALETPWFEDHGLSVNYRYGDPAKNLSSGFCVRGKETNSYARIPAKWTVEQKSRQSTGDGNCIITLVATGKTEPYSLPSFVYNEDYHYGFSWAFCDYYAGLLLPEDGDDTLYSYSYDANGESVHVEFSYTCENSRAKDLSHTGVLTVTVRMPEDYDGLVLICNNVPESYELTQQRSPFFKSDTVCPLDELPGWEEMRSSLICKINE